MIQPETHAIPEAPPFPNSRLPLLIYRNALPPDEAAIKRRFAENNWSNTWRNGIYDFHHFHSIAHEALGIAAAEAQVTFGGSQGATVTLRAGDVIVIPAGVAHFRKTVSQGLVVGGAYPGGAEYDLCRGERAEFERRRNSAARVATTATDPLYGAGGALTALWREANLART